MALGGRKDAETRFMEPTIVTGVTWEDAIMQVCQDTTSPTHQPDSAFNTNCLQDEIFGPLLPILNVSSADEVN